MPDTPKKEALHVKLPADLKDTLRTYANTHDASMTDVLTAALENFLNEDDYKTVSLEYLAEISRKYSTVRKRLDLFIEAFNLFLRLFLQHNPPLSEDLKDERSASARERHEIFIDTLQKTFRSEQSFRKSFEDVVPRPEDYPDEST
jgi:hypothetical protein